MREQSIRQDNKGFSLVELLVAIAVSSIVLIIIGSFLTNGTGFFRKQLTTVNLQTELQLTSNKVTDSLMEASALEIYKTDAGDVFVFTGDFTKPEDSIKSARRVMAWIKSSAPGKTDGHFYVIDWAFFEDQATKTAPSNEEICKLFTDASGAEWLAKNQEALEGYRMSEHVSSFTIALNPSCVTANMEEEHFKYFYTSPALVDVSLTVTGKVSNRVQNWSDSKSTTIRNALSSVIIEGNTYAKK